MAALDPIVVEIEVPAPPVRAFAAFTDGLGDWWPAEYTWSQDALETIAIEPREGGRCFERGPEGFECDWGRVTACEAPGRLAFRWQIDPQRAPAPDPAKASAVEVTFGLGGEGFTAVRLTHDGFERHGEGAEGYREALASPQGWPFILGRLVASLSDGS